ncbi:metalloregulator ArsR/SmtB family transcription factor [Diaminobutyricibacter sp. McL0618]|uniref:metalloregulator ArsR/SmtB family transcription factor n=1 Tax=Leifsonia sp. McL0618 TaxID=3415677 RepID=UPI003CF44DB1
MSGVPEASDTLRSLKRISDPTRARILSLILSGEGGRASVTRLADELDLTQPTVSHHLKVLLDDGLLQREPEGRLVWYSVVPDQVDRVSDLLQERDSSVPADAVLDRISADLAQRFVGVFAPETVGRYVRESYELLADQSGITRNLASLTSRFAADRLSALANQDHAAGDRPEVLFVCVQNAGRSQMAAAILKHLGGDRVHVRTAGSEPVDVVRPTVVAALDEIGVPIGGEYPKPLTDEVVRAADVVVTMGCGDACPVYPGRRYLDWELDDPAGQPLSKVREIRDDIEARVRDLLATL